MALTYLGDAAAWKQITPPQWEKQYIGQPDTCSIQYQGPQYLESTFLSALTAFQTMQTIAGLTVVDERGNNRGDAHMWLHHASSDDKAIMPVVTCFFMGVRSGTIPNDLVEDDITQQSATTSFQITESSSPNFGKSITISFSYYAARTNYEWCQLSDPAGNPTGHNTVRQQITYTGPYGDDNIFGRRFSGMIDDAGDSTTAISLGDATEVWNSFSAQEALSSFTSKEVIPSKLWQCNSTADFLLVG